VGRNLRIALIALCPLLLLWTPADARLLTIDDLLSLARVKAPALSREADLLVWQQSQRSALDGEMRSAIWLLDLRRQGAEPIKLAGAPAEDDQAPVFSPDGRTVYFQSNRAGEEAIWSVPATGGPALAVTSFRGGFRGFKLSPRGDKLLVWADRHPGARDLQPPEPIPDKTAPEVRAYDHLFVRHWNKWSDGTRSQLFVLSLTPRGAPGNGVAVAPHLTGDTPSKPDGGGEEVDWSPDESTIYFALREPGPKEALSTNLDIFAAAANGATPPVNLTADNRATDNWPTVSPDGRWLAWAAMKEPGYESDRTVVWLRDLRSGRTRPLTQSWDRSVARIGWSPDSRSLLAVASDHFDAPLFSIDLQGAVRRLTGAGTVAEFVPRDHGVIVELNTLTAPSDFFLCCDGDSLKRLTHVNAATLEGVEMPIPERFNFKGAAGDTVWGYVVKPPRLAEGAQAPIGFVVHGGPQSTVGNAWSYRWNAALFASAGFGMVFVDYHGSVGYGQHFTDSIQGDVAGKPFKDLKAGLAAAVRRYPWLQKDNACALGGSFGGFMMNWIEGHWAGRFKCLVQHDGLFDERAMAYETDELWYDRWIQGGHFYHEAPAAFERWNPVNAVAHWTTPMLVITSEGDFRIPYTQGLAAFTALQERGVPSRLLVFPHEGHQVVKPADSRRWNEEVVGWLRRWTAE
jgi:dipeptidyl aminopeptidase/acylaminoacyl peptidase